MRHISGINNSIADALSCLQLSRFCTLPLLLIPHPSLTFVELTSTYVSTRLNKLQTAGVAASTTRTYRAGTSTYSAFCKEQGIPLLPASELTLHYFCAYLSNTVSYSTLKVYLAGIWLLHIEHDYDDPTKDKWKYRSSSPICALVSDAQERRVPNPDCR